LKRCSIQRQENFDIVNKEIKVLQLFQGPYIVEYYGSEIVNTSKGREALILLGLCPGGNLFERLSARNGKYIPFQNCLRIFQQILLSVKMFHDYSPPVTHRDLKLENILFAAVRSFYIIFYFVWLSFLCHNNLLGWEYSTM
jgi:AP2-associated kinase